VWAVTSLIVGTVVLHRLIKFGVEQKNRLGVWTLILGQDQRVSTSKVQVVLWTYAIAFALLTLIFAGVNLGDSDAPGNTLQPEYLILLGSPAAAALLAKTTTTTKVQSGDIAKPEAPTDPGLKDGLSQVVSNDQGRIDFFDFQYALLNLVALFYFFTHFLADPTALPALPSTLVGLTGASAAGYAAKKGLYVEPPVLTGVYPSKPAPGEQILIRGKYLTVSSRERESVQVVGEGLESERTQEGDIKISGNDLSVQKSQEGDSNYVRVRFGGRYEQKVMLADVQPAATNEVEVQVPADVKPGDHAPIMVIRSDGIATEELSLDIAEVPQIAYVIPSTLVLHSNVGSNKQISIYGRGFGDNQRAAAAQPDSKPKKPTVILGGNLELEAQAGWGPRQMRANLPDLEDFEEEYGQELTSSTPVELTVAVKDIYNNVSQPVTVQLHAK
jgi:hypothetical protein